MDCEEIFFLVTRRHFFRAGIYDREIEDPISIFKIERIHTVRSRVITQHVFVQDLQPAACSNSKVSAQHASAVLPSA